MYEDELKHLSEKMDKSIQALRNEFTSIRTGQASPSLLDRVFVDYYGSKTPVTQVASVTVPEARMLVVQPWDKGILKDIEKAINMSDLGLVPMNDGNLIRMAIPQLTEQRRKDLVKVVNKLLFSFFYYGKHAVLAMALIPCPLMRTRSPEGTAAQMESPAGAH